MDQVKHDEIGQSGARSKLTIEPYFTRRVSEFQELQRQRVVDVRIDGADGPVFQQKGVVAPDHWSDQAVQIAAAKYLRGKLGTPDRETSIFEMIRRVADFIAAKAVECKYMGYDDANMLTNELFYLLLSQRAAFNSPVYFNVGIEEKPQCSACFILKVDDDMESILKWYRDEGMIFKGGSGSGVNVSALRSKREQLAGGGYASGPLSFMKAADASAGVIKSGGKTRRAAKMVVMNADHPDIFDFVDCKINEERKAWALIDAGYDSSLDGEAYASVYFQNANNSVRVSDEFMKAVEKDGTWQTNFVTTGEIASTFKARSLFGRIAEAAHSCGDPGLQFDTMINGWHTRPVTGRINASNPCSEFMSLDNTACNLASLNLLKFIGDEGEFLIEDFKRAIDILIIAMDILVETSSYPTPEIAKNAHENRELGLGYTNLGAAPMRLGLAYDSEDGRKWAACATAVLGGEAYLQSAKLAKALGPFKTFAANRAEMQNVISQHRAAAYKLITPANIPATTWHDAAHAGLDFGFRNAQITVLAPTGTISFMMDCDTTGVEPDIALVKYKRLVGGGTMKIVNHTVAAALKHLGYDSEVGGRIIAHIHEHETIEDAEAVGLKPEHLQIFDWAFKPANGKRSIYWQGHIKMMAAVQPFISGAISKTINMPADATVEDVEEAYMMAWKLGLKSVAIYRDGSKRTQLLNTSQRAERRLSPEARISDAKEPGPVKLGLKPVDEMPVPALIEHRRKLLPETRQSITHKFDIAGCEGYVTVGMYEDGKPGELFIHISKTGSTISGLVDAWATMVSFALQYGVPVEFLVKKFAHMRFEPSGFSKNPAIGYASSVVDYVARWLAQRFLPAEQAAELGVKLTQQEISGLANKIIDDADLHRAFASLDVSQPDAPICFVCGSLMKRAGSCHACEQCGTTSGCS